LGLSATIIRKDGQHPIVLMNLGEVRYSSVRSAVPLFEQKVFPRFTDFSTEHTAIHDIFHSLYQNEERNKLIIQDILTAYREGRECLVLSERIEHLDILRNALKEHVPSLFVLKGELGKKQLK
jgi:superfamily II DNA or RNA helicase